MLASFPLGSMDYSGDLTHKLYTNNNPMPLFFFGNGPSDLPPPPWNGNEPKSIYIVIWMGMMLIKISSFCFPSRQLR